MIRGRKHGEKTRGNRHLSASFSPKTRDQSMTEVRETAYGAECASEGRKKFRVQFQVQVVCNLILSTWSSLLLVFLD